MNFSSTHRETPAERRGGPGNRIDCRVDCRVDRVIGPGEERIWIVRGICRTEADMENELYSTEPRDGLVNGILEFLLVSRFELADEFLVGR